MSIQAIIRRSFPVVFALTVTGTALAQDGGYRGMLTRFPAAHAAPTLAAANGYRGSVARMEASPGSSVVATAPHGYRDVLVRFAVPSNDVSVQLARR